MAATLDVTTTTLQEYESIQNGGHAHTNHGNSIRGARRNALVDPFGEEDVERVFVEDANNKDKDKNNNNAAAFPINEEGDKDETLVTNDYMGLKEPKPCALFDSSEVQALATSQISDPECLDNSCGNDSAEGSGGCCRMHQWLICDKDNTLDHLQCVCNEHTFPAPTEEPSSSSSSNATQVSGLTTTMAPSATSTTASSSSETSVSTQGPTMTATTPEPEVTATSSPTEMITDTTMEVESLAMATTTSAPSAAATDAPTMATTEIPMATATPTEEEILTTSAPSAAATNAPTMATTEIPVTTEVPTEEDEILLSTSAPSDAATDAPTMATTEIPVTTEVPTEEDEMLITTTAPSDAASTNNAPTMSMAPTGPPAPWQQCAQGSMYHATAGGGGTQACFYAEDCPSSTECCIRNFCLCGNPKGMDSECVPSQNDE